MSNEAAIPYVRREPHELEYHAGFEDSIMRVVLNANSKREGVEVIMDNDIEPLPGQTLRASDIDHSTVPVVHDSELPLPLSDPRRIYASAVPGIKLTHPGGVLEGGPGIEPDDDDAFVREFLTRNYHITTPAELQAALQTDVEDNLELLQKRMHARQRAAQANEQLEKEIQNMVDTHNMEFKVRQRLMDEVRAKKEAREKKRRDREGG